MNESNNQNKNYLLLTIILVIFLITLAILIYFIRFRVDVTPNASSYNTTKSISVSNSYVFASPIRAKAGGDLIRVTAFILDSEGLGLFDKRVSLKSDLALDIKELQSLTDETGKALFDVGSDKKRSYSLEVFVDGIPLTQSIKVTFD